MKNTVVISGANGFIGSRLYAFFTSNEWEVRTIGRLDLQKGSSHLASILEGSKVLINLAGTPIIKRWSKRNRQVMRESRLKTTMTLVEAMKEVRLLPEVFMNASAIGIYPDRGRFDETSKEKAGDFLGELCVEWEIAAKQAPEECRVVLMRFGIILDARQGALARMLPLFRMGVGGKLGSGKQAFSWMHIEDLIRAIAFIIEHAEISGPVNFTTPGVVNNLTFTRQLALTLGRAAILPVPSWALRLLYGEGSSALLKGQYVLPKVLQTHDFEFIYPRLDDALKQLLKAKVS